MYLNFLWSSLSRMDWTAFDFSPLLSSLFSLRPLKVVAHQHLASQVRLPHLFQSLQPDAESCQVRGELTDVEACIHENPGMRFGRLEWSNIHEWRPRRRCNPPIGLVSPSMQKKHPPSSGPKSGRMRYQHWSLGQHFDEKACVRWEKT